MNIILIILGLVFSAIFVINFLKPEKRDVLNIINRIFVGLVFVFSGFVKAVDPMGATIKLTDYFNALGMESFIGMVFPISLLLSGAEFLIGFSLLVNVKVKWGAFFAFLFMVFFTPFTLYLAIANPVTDCGCFGDALVITNWQTFWKNIVILLPTILVYLNRDNITSYFNKGKEIVIVGLGAVAITMFSVYCDQHLPVLDFRPYKIGNNISALQKEIFELDENIPEEKAILDRIPINERTDSILTTFIYEKDGVKKEFSEVPEDETWQWLETINIVIKEGYHPPIHDFSISDLNGSDITNNVLSDTSYSFLIISYKINKADIDGVIAAAKLATQLDEYNFYFLTASLNEDINRLQDTLLSVLGSDSIDNEQTVMQSETVYYYEKDGEIMEFFEDELPEDDSWIFIGEETIESENNNGSLLPFNFYTTDETTLKTIIRSNPGLVLIKNGTIINKWAYRDIPVNLKEAIR